MDEIAFCENGNCMVIIYKTRKVMYSEGHKAMTNCPSCGKFGRLKNEPEGRRAIKDNPQG